MATADLSRRVRKVVGYPPLCEISDLQRRDFHEALLGGDTFEDLSGKWQAAIPSAEDTGDEGPVVADDGGAHSGELDVEEACWLMLAVSLPGRGSAGVRERVRSRARPR